MFLPNLTAMYAYICKAIDPVSTIEFKDLYKYCYGDSDEIDRTICFKENGTEKFFNAAFKYQKAGQEYLTSLIVETKYGYFLDDRDGNKLITAPNSYITKMLADFALI